MLLFFRHIGIRVPPFFYFFFFGFFPSLLVVVVVAEVFAVGRRCRLCRIALLEALPLLLLDGLATAPPLLLPSSVAGKDSSSRRLFLHFRGAMAS